MARDTAAKGLGGQRGRRRVSIRATMMQVNSRNGACRLPPGGNTRLARRILPRTSASALVRILRVRVRHVESTTRSTAPRARDLRHVGAASSAGFRFAVKASRFLTHRRSSRTRRTIDRLSTMRALGALGPVLYQLPQGGGWIGSASRTCRGAPPPHGMQWKFASPLGTRRRAALCGVAGWRCACTTCRSATGRTSQVRSCTSGSMVRRSGMAAVIRMTSAPLGSLVEPVPGPGARCLRVLQ